jgi:putative tryptophan/tyrosine transport system substrate-binding protein
MQRRGFITLVVGSVTWPLIARGQQTNKLPTIGLLFADPAVFDPWIAAFVERLNALGWIEGRTISLLSERDREIAADFIRRDVDVILTDGPAVAAVKRETSVIPIVFALASDPVGGGLVASLAHPGGNVTGMSLQSTDLAGKRIELLREVTPGLHRMAVMIDASFPQSVLEMGEVVAAARIVGIEVVPLEIRRAEDITPGYAKLNGRVDALYVSLVLLLSMSPVRSSSSLQSAHICR